MIFVRELILVDEDDTVIFKAKHSPADQALASALKVVQEKDGKGGLMKWLHKIDRDLAEHFNLR